MFTMDINKISPSLFLISSFCSLSLSLSIHLPIFNYRSLPFVFIFFWCLSFDELLLNLEYPVFSKTRKNNVEREKSRSNSSTNALNFYLNIL